MKYAVRDRACPRDLRNAIRLDQSTGVDAGLSEFGQCVTAFAQLVAGMRATGDVMDAEVLQVLIARLAELLGEPMPAGL